MAEYNSLQIKNAQLVAKAVPGAGPAAHPAQPAQPIQPALNREERLLIVEQALTLLEISYVHLPQKRAMYAVDPLQRLRLLKFRLDQSNHEKMPDERLFHNEMIEIFTQLRDLHTNYILPTPFRDYSAYLPFLIEEYREGKNSHFLVTKLDPNRKHAESFQEGVEILYWNGVPIKRAVELNAERQAGSNPDARYQRGLWALTIRPLSRNLPPDEEWVTLRYRTKDGKERDAEYRWEIDMQPPNLSAEEEAKGTGQALAFGFDIQWAQTQEVRRKIAAPKLIAPQDMSVAQRTAYRDSGSKLSTILPEFFRVREQATKFGTFGYLRIFSFMHPQAEVFVNEFKRLIEQLPQEGLIIDVRGNGGGNILASESLLQLLTPQTIEPARFQFINSPLTLALSQCYSDLTAWERSIVQSVETGAIESLSFPITPKEMCNSIGQVYHGPVILITDALCYSATDIFAAGFQDHRIGKVLGTSGNTGAGGANVWNQSDLCTLASMLSPRSPMHKVFKPLPHGAEMRVAIRRSLRVGENAGIPVEDLGIVSDEIHLLTKRDLLENNADLLDVAGSLLNPPAPD